MIKDQTFCLGKGCQLHCERYLSDELKQLLKNDYISMQENCQQSRDLEF